MGLAAGRIADAEQRQTARHLAAKVRSTVKFWMMGKQTGDSQSTIRRKDHLEMSVGVTGAGRVFDRLCLNKELKQYKKCKVVF